MNSGEVGILNVGAGDTKISFDPSNPADVERASRIVKDMIRRGYALLIEIGTNEKGPIYQRAHDFDEKTAEYIVVGVSETKEANEQPPRAPRRKAAGRKTQTRIPASGAKAVAVARVAGG